VHCKSLPAQEVRALLTARKLLQTKNHDVEMSLRRGACLSSDSDIARIFRVDRATISRIRRQGQRDVRRLEDALRVGERLEPVLPSDGNQSDARRVGGA
jgi:hypothetical protein